MSKTKKAVAVVGKFTKNLFVKKGKKLEGVQSVRYDGDKGKWAILDKDMNPTKHFSLAILRNVKFGTHKTESYSDCRASTDYIGVATGELFLGEVPASIENAENLTFTGKGGFKDYNGNSKESAKLLYLMADRRAVAWF
jgi:hypothetical protein